MTDEVVAGRDENLPDQHRTDNERLADPKANFADNFATETLF